MSYTFLLEQGEESSAASFSDIPASVLSRLNLTGEKCCSNGSEMESCPDSPSGMTSGHSMASHGGEKSMLSVEDGPAQEFPRPASCEVFNAQAQDFGLNSPALLARYCRHSSSWKTLQQSLFSDWDISLAAFPAWGMTQDGVLSAVQKPAWTVMVNGSGCLRRPQAKDGRGFYKVSMESTRKRMANPDRQMMLIHQLLLSAYPNMKAAVANPPFWESLMDWPIGWTDLKPLAQDKFQVWLSSHGKP